MGLFCVLSFFGCLRALVGVTDSDGKSIFAGRQATGFTNAEEIAADMVDVRVLLFVRQN